MGSVGFEAHEHVACADETIGAVELYCSANRLQFTPTRRRVLEFLLEDHKALGAYDILQRLASEGRAAQPSVAYWALNFLLKHGVVHKVKRLNAHIPCSHPLEAHTPVFMICRACHFAVEATFFPAKSMLGKAARKAGFRIERTIVEAEGLCPNCIGIGAPA